MKQIDENSRTSIEKLQKIADQSQDPQVKKAIEEKIKTIGNDKIVRK